MSVINDDELGEAIVRDAMENYGVDEAKAKQLLYDYGSYIVDQMWDAYSQTMEGLAYELRSDIEWD